MSEEDEDNMPDDKLEDSTHSGEGDGDVESEVDVVIADVVVADVDRDGDGETRGEDEEANSFDDFFDEGEGAVIGPDHLSLCATSEGGQSGGGGITEDDPVGPVTPSAVGGPTATIPRNNNKPTAVDFSSRTISSASTDLDDEEWVNPMPIPPTPLEPDLPIVFILPIITKTKSPDSAKSRSERSHVRMYRSRRAWRKVRKRTGRDTSRR